MELLSNKPWLSEVGLILDMLAFWILSWDLIRSVREERLARDEIQKLERGAFNARYGVFAPSHEVVEQQQLAFEEQQAKRRSESEADIGMRQCGAWVAIILAGVGFVLQIWGGWPSA